MKKAYCLPRIGYCIGGQNKIKIYSKTLRMYVGGYLSTEKKCSSVWVR